MNGTRILGRLGIVICLLAACSPSETKTSPITQTVSANTHEPASLPLSEFGPYGLGMRKLTLTDPARNDREVTISIWYPAVRPAGSPSIGFTRDADPDLREAPYPLLLSSTKVAYLFAPYLVSHGFIWASVDKIDTYYSTNPEMLHQPLDILFTLEQVASNPPQGFEEMIDAEHAGATGYSFDGFNALMLSGARIDPQLYLELCADPEQTMNTVDYWFDESYNCGLAKHWDTFSAVAGEELTANQDGLWQPVTDERIRAVLPMAADGFYLFGEKGLAAADRPVLMIVGSLDTLLAENALIFEHLGTSKKTMVTFIDRDHGMIYDPDMQARMAHFMVAFFGYFLQGRADYAEYFSENFVAQYNDLTWGVNKK